MLWEREALSEGAQVAIIISEVGEANAKIFGAADYHSGFPRPTARFGWTDR